MEGLIDEEMQMRCEVLSIGVFDGVGGSKESGSVSRRKSRRGIELMTTLGTLYCRCRILSALRRERRSFIVVLVSVLYRESSIIFTEQLSPFI